MLERDVESHLVQQTTAIGGKAFKFVSPSTAGASDRLVLLPVPPEHREIVQRYVKLVEVKRPGEKQRPLQVWFQKEITSLGHCALCVDSKEAINQMLKGSTLRLKK